MTKREYKYHQSKKARKGSGKLTTATLMAAYDILKEKRDSIVTKDLFVGRPTIDMLKAKAPEAECIIPFAGFRIKVHQSSLFPFQMSDGSMCHGIMIPQPEIEKLSWVDEVMEQERKRFVDDLYWAITGRRF